MTVTTLFGFKVRVVGKPPQTVSTSTVPFGRGNILTERAAVALVGQPAAVVACTLRLFPAASPEVEKVLEVPFCTETPLFRKS